jgi:release factor glutamine methyltransferase
MNTPRTFRNFLRAYAGTLDTIDIGVLLAKATDSSREFVLAHPEFLLDQAQRSRANDFLKRREKFEPLAYIIGEKEFFGRSFFVTPSTLIPRPETELLIESVLARHRKATANTDRLPLIADIGTGSGCIAITLACELPRGVFLAGDISQEALAIASENAKRHRVGARIFWHRSDLLDEISDHILNRCRQQSLSHTITVTANLPYLSHEIYASSMPDVKNFEPKLALVSDRDGLQHYQRLLKQLLDLRHRLVHNAFELFFEISPEQKHRMQKLVQNTFPQATVDIRKDTAHRHRLAIIDIPPEQQP